MMGAIAEVSTRPQFLRSPPDLLAVSGLGKDVCDSVRWKQAGGRKGHAWRALGLLWCVEPSFEAPRVMPSGAEPSLPLRPYMLRHEFVVQNGSADRLRTVHSTVIQHLFVLQSRCELSGSTSVAPDYPGFS